MSRNPPFSSQRARSSSQASTTSTRPLQIHRPSRPTTPTGSSRITPGNISSPGPARPVRSERRGQGYDYSDRPSSSQRDSVATTNSDMSTAHSRHARTNGNGIPPPPSTSARDAATPAAIPAIMSAFHAAGTRRRAMTNGSDDFEYQREREREAEAERIRQQRIQERVPGRRTGTRTRTGDIDAVLDRVREDWEFVVDENFNTVDLALQLLDQQSSSPGKDMDSFRRTKDTLARALKGSVDRYYMAFNAALPHHSSLLNHLGVVQDQIKASRAALTDSKDSLGNRRADLVQLWSRGQSLEDMMKLLDQIEHLKTVPDVLETLISEKRFLQASVLLIRSLKIITSSDMQEIGAVSDLRSYLIGQETSLREILIDELHSHLYLRSFWCESRWVPYIPNQQTFSKPAFEDDTDGKLRSTLSDTGTTRSTRLSRYLYDLGMRPNDAPYDSNSNENVLRPLHAEHSADVDSELNPEADSFSYIEAILESIAALGKLGTCLDVVSQRLPNEIFSMVETSLEEISERADQGRRNTLYLSNPRVKGVYLYTSSIDPLANLITSPGENLNASRLRMAALESSAKVTDLEVLKDFFWTLYSKMDAVSQGLRVVYEVSNRIGSRRDFKDSSGTKPGALFPLGDIWSAIHTEIKTLIYDYLTSEEQGIVSGRNPISSINEILREGRLSLDRTKTVFRFSDVDAKNVAKLLKPHEEELLQVLRNTMPGLVQNAADNAVQSTLSSVGTEDRLLGVGQQHHVLLIKPDAFHINVLFQPTLAFLSRVGDVFPSGPDFPRVSGDLMDDFVLKVYLPQLEEKVTTLFHDAVTGADAFLPDPLSNKLSTQPLSKSSVQLIALINSLCFMLQTTPVHHENYSRLILSVVIQFYQRCSDRYKDLVTLSLSSDIGEPQIALAAQWAQRSDLSPCLSELAITQESKTSRISQLTKQEMNLELGFLGQRTVQRSDLIPSVRNVAALASLHSSVTWFASTLLGLKSSSGDEFGSPDGLLSPKTIDSLSTLSPIAPQPAVVSASPPTLHLPLSKEMSLRFHALLKTFEQLGSLILDTIRIDIRCRTMFYLESALQHGNYSIEGEAGEPDPHVLDLNAELNEIDALAANSLSDDARRFILLGLGHLMEEALISNARLLRVPTAFGIKKILRNVLALQQSIKSILLGQQSCEFDRAKRYYSFFFMTPHEMLESIKRKEHAFTFEEYQMMLRLQCGVQDTETPRGRQTMAMDRNYSMYVIDLHGLELESSAS